MSLKWKAVIIWLFFPYLLALIGFILIGDLTPKATLSWHVQRVILFPCFVTVGLGVPVVWNLNARRKWPLVLMGSLTALGMTLFSTVCQMFLWGGFEEDGPIFLACMTLVLPSCIAGAYSAFLYFREKSLHNAERDPTA